jgi:hypothetical protein
MINDCEARRDLVSKSQSDSRFRAGRHPSRSHLSERSDKQIYIDLSFDSAYNQLATGFFAVVCDDFSQGEGGLTKDSVALCHQLRVLDGTRLLKRLGSISNQTLVAVESAVLFTTGIL